MTHKVHMTASSLREIMGEAFDYDQYEQGRRDCRDLAGKASYDRFAEELKNVQRRLENASFSAKTGPSYWIGCLCEYDFAVWPKKNIPDDEQQNKEVLTMSNLSGCRFHNTGHDLEECLDAIRDNKRISETEAGAGLDMFKDFLDFCQENYIIDSYDTEMVESLFENMKEAEDNE